MCKNEIKSKISIKNVDKYYNHIKILDKINIDINENECIGIMGESGSGKSTLAKLIVKLENFENGDIFIDNISLKNINRKNRKDFYKKIQIVFQNSLNAVNNKFKIYDILLEPLNIHYKNIFSKKEKDEKIISILKEVGLEKDILDKNPTQLSGGQLQRICIARALILEPEIIIFDESLSGLDPIIQYKIMKLLGDLKDKLKLTYIFITHDFKLCYYLCDRVYVMENGEIIDIIKNIDENIEKIEYKTNISKEIVESIL